MTEATHASDSAGMAAVMEASEKASWRARVRVDKFDDDQVAWVARESGLAVPDGDTLVSLVAPYEVVEQAGNLVTTAGWTRLTSLMVAGGGQGMTNTATRIGTGNSSTAAAIGQTDLQAAAGSANRWFQIMDATYPSVATNVLTAKSTFATGDGNFVWAEWGMDIGTPSVTSGNTVNATLVNRAVQALGTKASGSWVITATITFT